MRERVLEAQQQQTQRQRQQLLRQHVMLKQAHHAGDAVLCHNVRERLIVNINLQEAHTAILSR